MKTSHHCKYNINYHIIWIPKYRKPVLVDKVKGVLKAIIDGQCQELGIYNLALEIMPDHLHLFVGAKPTVTPFKIIHKLKGNTSIQLRRVFPDLKYLEYKQHFGEGFDALWARGYYCGSASHVSQEQVKRYIQEQMGKSFFEYGKYFFLTCYICISNNSRQFFFFFVRDSIFFSKISLENKSSFLRFLNNRILHYSPHSKIMQML